MEASPIASGTSELVDDRDRVTYCPLSRLERFWVPGATTLGITVGILAFAISKDQYSTAPFWHGFSYVLGWTYFCMWSVSFYPQVVQNFARRSVVGLSVEYQLLNCVGFLCYFIFNAAYLWSSAVRKEYRDAYQGHDSSVRLNDVAFSLHALILTLITLAQICAFYDYPPLEGSNRILRVIVVVIVLGVLAFVGICAALTAATAERHMSWLELLLGISYVKVAISVAKYCPQVWMNYCRKSTDGWNIHNVILDFSGGFLSVMQQVLDASLSHDWSALTGDPAKFLLGNFSIFFDVVFMIQHYILYPKRTLSFV